MGRKGRYTYEYPRPALTADCVVFGHEGSTIKLILIKRAIEPFQGMWALPGGFVEMDETTEECAQRELEEETGLSGIELEQLHTFSKTDRDPRGRTVSVVYLAVTSLENHKPKAGDDAADVQWFAIDQLPPLAFDHEDIVKMAISRVKEKTKQQ
jgi:8-oxo-dGTP diphosphatase